MYVARTQEEILAEMLAESTLPSSKIEGTFEYDVLASNAVEFAKTEVEMAEMHQSAFGMTAWDEYLDMKAEGHGVIRREAVKAIGTVTVTGNGTVEEGSYFQTVSGIRFVTLETVTVDGSAEINIEAVNAGASGNVAVGTIIEIPINIPGIRSVTNAEATHDGYDREDDETYRARYLKHVRLPAVSSCISHSKINNIETQIVGTLNYDDFYQGLIDYFSVIHVNDEILLRNYIFNFLRSPDYKTDVNLYLPKFLANDSAFSETAKLLRTSPMTVENTNRLVNLFTDDGQGGFLEVHPETDSELVNGLKELIQGGTSAYTVDLPVQSGSLIYNGTTLQPRWTSYDQTKLTIAGITEATNAGTYQATFTPKGDYEWSDGSKDTLTVEWTISRAVIETPTCSGSFTYDTTSKSPTMSYDTAATIVDGTTSAVNAATYTVGFTPDSNHCWSGGTYERKSFTWTIDKAAGSLSLTKTTMSLNNDKVSDTCTVTRAGTGTITVTSNNTSIATVSLSGTTITVTAVDSGSATITVSVAADSNYNAPASKTISVTTSLYKALSACTPAEMQTYIKNGKANAAWSVGDTFTTTINSKSYNVKLIGIDHNSSIEGTKRCHFQIDYDQKRAMNSTATNAGGWASCEMRTYLNNTFFNLLPSNLRSVITACTKWSDNGSSAPSSVNDCSSTSDKIWLLSYKEKNLTDLWALDKNCAAYTTCYSIGWSRTRVSDQADSFFTTGTSSANNERNFYPAFTIS